MTSMARLMGNWGLVDPTAAANTPPEAFYHNGYIDEVKQSGFLAEVEVARRTKISVMSFTYAPARH